MSDGKVFSYADAYCTCEYVYVWAGKGGPHFSKVSAGLFL